MGDQLTGVRGASDGESADGADDSARANTAPKALKLTELKRQAAIAHRSTAVFTPLGVRCL